MRVPCTNWGWLLLVTLYKHWIFPLMKMGFHWIASYFISNRVLLFSLTTKGKIQFVLDSTYIFIHDFLIWDLRVYSFMGFSRNILYLETLLNLLLLLGSQSFLGIEFHTVIIWQSRYEQFLTTVETLLLDLSINWIDLNICIDNIIIPSNINWWTIIYHLVII